MTIDIKHVLEYSKDMRVLYVEDDEIVRHVTQKIFDRYFKQIDVAVDGADGLNKYLDFYKKEGEYYDLILTDINMPNLDGIAMGQKIMDENFVQSIVYITAHNDAHYLSSAIKAGAAGFLQKPLDLDEFKVMLFKVAQNIFDHKMVDHYYKEIEALNNTLQDQNRELSEKNSELEKSLRMLDTMVNKDAIKQTKQTKESKKEVGVSWEDMDEFTPEDLDELIDAYDVIDTAVVEVLQSQGNYEVTKRQISTISERFAKYSSTISYYTAFASLGASMGSFSRVLKSEEVPEDSANIMNVFTLLESFIFVLKKWQEGLSIQAYESINFLDASLISDMETIIMMWQMSEEEEELDFENDDGFEFF